VKNALPIEKIATKCKNILNVNPRRSNLMARKKIKIDASACMGCGACAGAYPDDIVLNDNGVAEAITGEADEEVVSVCPFGAISEEE